MNLYLTPRNRVKLVVGGIGNEVNLFCQFVSADCTWIASQATNDEEIPAFAGMTKRKCHSREGGNLHVIYAVVGQLSCIRRRDAEIEKTFVPEFKEYWVNTGSMSILADIFFKGSVALKDDMAGLLTGTPIKMKYVEHITYPVPYERDDIFWSMLLNTGYIKPCAGSTGDNFFYAELVNREVKNIFADCIKLWFQRQQQAIHRAIAEFVDYLLKGDADGVSDTLNKELLNNPSCYDFKEENSYHMFIFGILLAVEGDYTVYSNPESGKGRSDCLIKPFDKEKYAVVIEFKHCREEHSDSSPECSEALKAEARKGLKQLEEKAYIYNLKKEGYARIFKYGIAFHKKNCEVAMEIQLL